MFDFRRRREEKQMKNRVFQQAQAWKRNALLQECLTALRGCCTVADMDHREAVEGAVFLANTEGDWRELGSIHEDLPEGWLNGDVFILWDEATLPVLRCPAEIVLENLNDVTAVAFETYLVARSMDRIVHIGTHGIRLYPNE